ncbi:MAG TPA: TolC family protein [Chitinophagaceae bacterium]
MPSITHIRYSFTCVLLLSTCAIVYGQSNDLQFYLQQGVGNSPLLKDYQNQIRSGGIDSMLIRASHRPQVLANGQLMVAPTINGYGYDQAITNGGNYAATVGASQPIFNRKILEPQYRGILLQNQTIGNTAQISELDVKKNITAQYVTAYADYQQMTANREVYELLHAQQELLKQLVQRAVYKQTDYLNFQVALQSQEITLSQLQIQYRSDIASLNYICGINDTGMVILASPDMMDLSVVDRPHSVFFRQFTLDSLKIVNNKALVDTKYRPSVNWFADAGLQSSQLNTAYKSFGASFGVNLSVPIYDGKQRQLEYRRLKIEEDTRNNYASFFDRQYDQQVAMLLQQLKAEDGLVNEIKEKLKVSQLLMDISKKQLNTGDLRITDYILAINNYLSVKGSLNQAEINRYQIINQLNYWYH